MAKRDEEATIEAVAVDSSMLSCRQPIHGYTNRKLELSTDVWSTVDSDLQKAGDVSAVGSLLGFGRIRVGFGIYF